MANSTGPVTREAAPCFSYAAGNGVFGGLRSAVALTNFSVVIFAGASSGAASAEISVKAASPLSERPGPLDAKAAELVMTFVEHTSEHYGQLAVYARLNGIVPPVSRI